MTKTNTQPLKRRRKIRYGDSKQEELYKKFPPDSFLGDDSRVDHFLLWMTFFRRNFHRFASDYLGIKLNLYQSICLYLMGINYFFVIIASRGDAKSFIVALASCIYCILYPGSMVVMASGTKKQAKLLVSEKIEKELMNWSPALRKEIVRVKDNQSEVVVFFKNHSTITVVAPGDTGRGYRSTILIREEFRQIKKEDEDGILSPYQQRRQPPYLKDPYYSSIDSLKEESTDIYISSSWMDNGHYMWSIVDQAADDMLRDRPSCLLSFDESVALCHELKSQRFYITQKKKQDRLTFDIEILNLRVKDNLSSYFTYSMFEKNQRVHRAFYPRTALDYLAGKKNQYAIAKQPGEVRIVSCDMAFVENRKNDNSIFSCIRLLPESTRYSRNGSDDLEISNGYRRIVSYMESIQGGDTVRQARRIRQLFEDWSADYIVLDMRNGGIIVYDMLARVMFDDERNVEYSPLLCMNDETTANRVRAEGATPCIYAIIASQKINSDIAIDFRRVLGEGKIDFLVNFEQASEDFLPKIKEYVGALDGETQAFYEAPFLETQALISEATTLMYEKKADTGAIVIKEQSGNRKDRYTSVSYGSYFASLLERENISNQEEYEYGVFIN